MSDVGQASFQATLAGAAALQRGLPGQEGWLETLYVSSKQVGGAVDQNTLVSSLETVSYKARHSTQQVDDIADFGSPPRHGR